MLAARAVSPPSAAKKSLVVWLIARPLWGRAGAVLALGAMLVPLLNLFLVWRLSASARAALVGHGLAASLLRVQRAPRG
jgi:hypothetical protein